MVKSKVNKGFSVDDMERILENQGDIEDIVDGRVKNIIQKEVQKELSKEEIIKAVRLNPECIDILMSGQSKTKIMKELTALLKKSDRYLLTENEISYNARKIMEMLMSYIEQTQDLKLAERFLGKLSDLKKSFYPATQKNMNVNVDLFEDQLRAWRNARKEIYEVKINEK